MGAPGGGGLGERIYPGKEGGERVRAGGEFEAEGEGSGDVGGQDVVAVAGGEPVEGGVGDAGGEVGVGVGEVACGAQEGL